MSFLNKLFGKKEEEQQKAGGMEDFMKGWRNGRLHDPYSCIFPGLYGR